MAALFDVLFVRLMSVSDITARGGGRRRLAHLLLLVLELNVQALLNPNLHLDRVIDLWLGTSALHAQLHLLSQVPAVAFGHGGSDEVPNAHVEPAVGLVVLLDIVEGERQRLGVEHGCRRLQLPHHGNKVKGSSPVIEHLNPPKQLHLDSQMLQLLPLRKLHHNLRAKRA